DIAANLRKTALDRDHLAELIGPAIHHGDVIIGALFGSDLTVVLQVAVTIVCPHGRNLWRDLEMSLLNQSCSLLPKVGHKFCLRPYRTHDAHLRCDCLAD